MLRERNLGAGTEHGSGSEKVYYIVAHGDTPANFSQHERFQSNEFEDIRYPLRIKFGMNPHEQV
jgi:hypothetical protein